MAYSTCHLGPLFAERSAVLFMAVCLILFLGRLFTEPEEQFDFKPVPKPPVII